MASPACPALSSRAATASCTTASSIGEISSRLALSAEAQDELKQPPSGGFFFAPPAAAKGRSAVSGHFAVLRRMALSRDAELLAPPLTLTANVLHVGRLVRSAAAKLPH